MLQFLFDTDHLTLYQHGHPRVTKRLQARPTNNVAVSPVTVEEALRGRLAVLSHTLTGSARINAYARMIATIELIMQFPIVPFDQASEDGFQQNLRLRLRIGTRDQKIAAVALAHGMTLLTRNRRDFTRIPNLQIEDWSV